MFKKGDLFFLNEEGKALFYHLNGENGIIISDGYVLYDKDIGKLNSSIEYYGYDILIKGILFREVPEKFLIRVVKR